MRILLMLILVFVMSVNVILADNYALLISTQTASTQSCEALSFWRDLYVMYAALVENGYDHNDIFVVYGSGSDYLDTPMYRVPSSTWGVSSITDYAATNSNHTTVYTALNDSIQNQEDNLFIWWKSHGDSTACAPMDSEFAYPNEGFKSDDYLYGKLNSLQGFRNRIVVIEACHAGGILDEFSGSSKTLVIAAAERDLAVRITDDEPGYDPMDPFPGHAIFTLEFTAALRGKDPDGTSVFNSVDGIISGTNSDGFISYEEAVYYADFISQSSTRYDEDKNLSCTAIVAEHDINERGEFIFVGGDIKQDTTISYDMDFSKDVIVNKDITLTIDSIVLDPQYPVLTFEKGDNS